MDTTRQCSAQANWYATIAVGWATSSITLSVTMKDIVFPCAQNWAVGGMLVIATDQGANRQDSPCPRHSADYSPSQFMRPAGLVRYRDVCTMCFGYHVGEFCPQLMRKPPSRLGVVQLVPGELYRRPNRISVTEGICADSPPRGVQRASGPYHPASVVTYPVEVPMGHRFPALAGAASIAATVGHLPAVMENSMYGGIEVASSGEPRELPSACGSGPAVGGPSSVAP